MRRTDLALAPAWRSSARPLVSRRPPLTGPDQACMDAEAGSLVNAYTPYRLQSEATVSRIMPRRFQPPSQTWNTFLANHLTRAAAIDFFVVPTATFRSLYVFVVLAHERRRIVHCNVTDAPSASWTGQQVINAFPYEAAPRYLHRDRDALYGSEFISRVRSMGIEQVVSAAHSPWQNPYVERVIGSLRRECTDHVIVTGAPAPSASRVRDLLQRRPHACRARQGLAGDEARAAARSRAGDRAAEGRWTPSSLRQTRRLTF
jgi:transposase InsO family protein